MRPKMRASQKLQRSIIQLFGSLSIFMASPSEKDLLALVQ